MEALDPILPDASNAFYLPDVIAQPIIGLTNLMVSLGLTTPLRRFAFTATAAALAINAAQPSAMYEKGVPRPFAAVTDLHSAASRGIHPTWTPWWSVPLLSGAAVAFFI